MSIKQRMREVLEETINYYDSPEKFGYGKFGCVYFGEHGQMCAVGRCLKCPDLIQQFSRSGPAAIDSLFKEGVITGDSFKEDYQGLPLSFWINLQGLHDSASNNGYNSIKSALESKISYSSVLHNVILKRIESGYYLEDEVIL